MSAGWTEAKTGDDSHGCHTQQQMEAFVPSDAIAPADIGLSSQPTRATAFGIAGDRSGAIEDFIQTCLSLEQAYHVQSKGSDGIAKLSQESVELTAMRQLRKG